MTACIFCVQHGLLKNALRHFVHCTCFASVFTGPVATRGWLLSVVVPKPMELLSAQQPVLKYQVQKLTQQAAWNRAQQTKRWLQHVFTGDSLE